MSKSFSLKPKEEKKLLEKAQPVVTIFSAISSLQKKIAEIKNKKVFKKNILKNSKYYQTLGLSLGSSAEKVQKAYKKLASKWHPDKPAPSGFTKEQQTEEFQKVNEAANFLLGQEKKRSNDKGSEKLNQQIVANERLIKSDGADESEVRDQNKEEVEKRKQASLEEIEKLQIKLQEKEKELQKLGEKKVNEGKKAIRFLLHYNQNLVKYIVNGYPSFGGRIDPDELTAEGISSLPKAIEKFDLKSKNRFATYAGFWIKQYIQSFINKNQLINQGSSEAEKKSVIYYDSAYRNDDKESKSYSLVDTLNDDENSELTAEEVRHQDTVIQVNNVINALEDREVILLIRLTHKIRPTNLLDVYYLATEEEKKELKKETKLNDKSDQELLRKYSCEEKKILGLPIIKKYLNLFTKKYKFSELSKLINKSENVARRLKQEGLKKLQKLAKERKLHFLVK